MSKVEAPNCVTIFGGGVAGLTAAHELVERGFRVQVWEKELDQRHPWRGCVVGGMARTQWSRIHCPETLDTADPWPRIEPLGIEVRWGVDDGDWSDKWYGVAANEQAPVDESAALEALKRALFLGDLDVNDEEPNLDVVVYSRPNNELCPLSQLSKEEATEQERLIQEDGRKATDKALKFLRLLPGFKQEHMHIARPRGNAMRVRMIRQIEPEWIAEVTKASVRLEFFYTPPWGQPTTPIVHIPQKFYYRRTNAGEASALLERKQESSRAPDTPKYECRSNFKVQALGEHGVGEPTEVVREFMQGLSHAKDIRHVYVEVADRRWWNETGKQIDDRWDIELASCIQQEFAGILRNFQAFASQDVPSTELFPWHSSELHQSSDRRTLYTAVRLPNGRIITFTAVRLQAFPYEHEDIDVVLQFRVREFWLPGEHGYRFFPSFYHHVFDTMRRTPILEGIEQSPVATAQEFTVYPDRAKYVESFRTVFDNLRSQRFTALAFADGKRPTLINRAAVDSIEEAVEVFRTLFGQPAEGGVGFNMRDWSRFTLRFLQYLSSSAARREEYERISWWDFVEGPTYAPNSQAALVRFPKALVAMDAVEADARTIGSSGAQTLLDQFKRSTEFRDGTLKGPTSEAWFKYWRRYLEAQGVEFIHGKLNRLLLRTFAADEPGRDEKFVELERVWPDVECYEPKVHFENVGTETEPGLRPCLMPGYFVLALSADEVKRVAADFYASYDREQYPHRDLERAADLELGNPKDPVPSGELRHFAGIQYYFEEEDVLWIDGHVYLPHSPWAITSISQSRFWENKQEWERGYRGIVSTIIGKWDVPGDLLGKTAWDCTPDELAREVWYQLSKAMEQTPRTRLFDGRPPRPIFWHLDDSMRFDGTKTPHWTNQTPFQIETPGRYDERPGDLGHLGYSTELGIGLCGTYMKTHTRITSMEAANESARHVVNAILCDVASPFRRTPCEISPIEAREIRDFDLLKEVDAELHQRGLPHMLDIIGVDRFFREWWPDDQSFVREPLMLLERFRQLLKQWIKDHHPGGF